MSQSHFTSLLLYEYNPDVTPAVHRAKEEDNRERTFNDTPYSIPL